VILSEVLVVGEELHGAPGCPVHDDLDLAGERDTGTVNRVAKPDILILDDFGMRLFPSLEAQDFCEILEERPTGKATMITTQLPLDHWQEVLPDPVIADAILDRLKHAAIQLKITGESYRKIKAKKLETGKECRKRRAFRRFSTCRETPANKGYSPKARHPSFGVALRGTEPQLASVFVNTEIVTDQGIPL
jgi:hypothetical protein